MFTWLGSSGGAAEAFVKSFSVLPEEDKAVAVARTCFVHTENTHLRPSWWASLTTPQREDISRLMHLGLGGNDRDENSLRPSASTFTLSSKAMDFAWL